MEFPERLESFQVLIETFQMTWKLSWWSGILSDNLETFWMIWKHSRWSGNFPDDLETFLVVRNFPDYVDTIQIIWKLSRSSGNFRDHLKMFPTIWKLSKHVLETVIKRVDFIVKRKNFPDAQKLSGWQCQPGFSASVPPKSFSLFSLMPSTATWFYMTLNMISK